RLRCKDGGRSCRTCCGEGKSTLDCLAPATTTTSTTSTTTITRPPTTTSTSPTTSTSTTTSSSTTTTTLAPPGFFPRGMYETTYGVHDALFQSLGFNAVNEVASKSALDSVAALGMKAMVWV